MATPGWPRVLALTLAAMVGLGACGDNGSSRRARERGGDEVDPATVGSFTDESITPGKTRFDDDDDDEVIKAAVVDVEEFWQVEFPRLYDREWTDLEGGAYPYGPSDPPPDCGRDGTQDYADVESNAFYCAADDFLAWDTDALTNQLLDEFGPLTLAIVVAHELGHKVQNEHGMLDDPQYSTFLTEQQADCFAGAWTRYVAEGGSSRFRATDADLDNALGGFLQIRDPLGTDFGTDPNAHGSAFQRIGAFEEGLRQGAAHCQGYEEEGRSFIPEDFNDTIDFLNEGNLPYAQVEPLVVANLNAFWSRVFVGAGATWAEPAIEAFDPDDGVRCGPRTFKGDEAIGLALYCEAEDKMAWDERDLMPTVYEVGDLAQGTVIANLFSARAQQLAGQPTGTLDAVLQVDCLTGTWVGTTKSGEINESLPPQAQLVLSPGDLDEAVASLIQFGPETDSPSPEGGAGFQRLDAFRAGFFAAYENGYQAGFRACAEGQGSRAAD
ncbi:MAG: neutral zinc metallopeptidase [Acidimicrobiia bacterium]